MVRSYVQRERAESSAATRLRMIEAARSLLVEGEAPGLEISEVAERAGVARSTVYLSFGTRAAFLSSILDDSLSRAGFGRLREHAGLADAREAMDRVLAQTATMYATDHSVLRRMLLLARLDSEVAGDYQVRQQRRAEAVRGLARRLRRQRHLRTDVSIEAAASVLWVLTSFEAFDQLFSGWGLDAAACGERMAMMAHTALLQRSD
jgi:AcrR family transcriptional regulator